MRSAQMLSNEATVWQPLTLSSNGGPRIYIEAISRGGREEVGLKEAIPFQQITDVVAEIACGIAATLEKAKPNKATVELGVEFGLEAGNLVALIARGSGKANLKISLEWERTE